MKYLLFLMSFPLWAANQLENVNQTRAALGLDRFAFNARLSQMKIAVIDNGFMGMESDPKFLPDSAKLVLKYDPEFITKHGLGDPNYNEAPAQTEHGRIMAQIIWATTGLDPRGPQFFLLNANGITNFRRAVRYAIEEKVDIILYSQNRECCGNFDGRGFYNDIVNQATSAGVLWVNAAGNYGGAVYNGPAVGGKTEFKVKSHLDENSGQLILTWNSSGPEETSGTDKDLDLYIYDENGNEVAKNTLRQVLKKAELAEGETFLPRERIRFNFSKNSSLGVYKVVVKAQSTNFSEADKIRLVLIPDRAESLLLLDATPGGEIMVPADNSSVITVGDLSSASAKGPTADGRVKPEVILENSVATFTNGYSSMGTSNAAAYFAGILAVLKSYRPSLNRLDVLAFPKRPMSTLSIEKIALSEFALMHKRILEFIEDLTNESPVLAGRFRDGRYILGTRKNPGEVLQSLCRRRNETDLEYYLAIESNTSRAVCYTRKNERYPWEYNGGDRHAWVEIRQAHLTFGASPSNAGTWLTPSPEQIR